MRIKEATKWCVFPEHLLPGHLSMAILGLNNIIYQKENDLLLMKFSSHGNAKAQSDIEDYAFCESK